MFSSRAGQAVLTCALLFSTGVSDRAAVLVTVDELGWKYQLNEAADSFTFGS